jgi:hypothetical protein
MIENSAMPIYEYYCPDNHRIYQFFAKTLAQGRSIPKCPDNPAYRMVKMLSAFSVGGGKAEDSASADAPAGPAGDADDPRMEAAMSAMESEFSSVDENDPRAMGRMMRRMAELTGEKIDGEMEEVVRKLEEGADPDSLEEQLGGDNSEGGEGEGGEGQGGGFGIGPGGGPLTKEQKENAHRFRVRRSPPVRDPKLYDY